MVKLTDFGKKKLHEQHNELFHNNKEIIPYKEMPEKDGWSKWQLWDLMERLGKYCHLGMDNQPFLPSIKIIIENECDDYLKIGLK